MRDEDAMKDVSATKLAITFEGRALPDERHVLNVTGAAAESLRKPEKIKELMDLLELPEGTNAKLVCELEGIIVR